MITRAALFAQCANWTRRIGPHLRGQTLKRMTGIAFSTVGHRLKLYGCDRMQIGERLRVGDYCWLEAVTEYAGCKHDPLLTIGKDVAMSDLTHISCVHRITIGDECLLGSKVYIGDHAHGSTEGGVSRNVAPGKRPLGNISPIFIGARTWIGDGAVILGGAEIAAGSVVGANSIVMLKESRPALIAGVPAKVIRYLDSEQIESQVDEQQHPQHSTQR